MRATARLLMMAGLVAGCSHLPSETPSAATVSRPLTDFAEKDYYSFKALDGQIQCRVKESVSCQTEERLYTVPDGALCGYYPDVEQGHANRFVFNGAEQPCATITQGEGYLSPHVLAAGETVTVELSPGRTITCAAADDELTCTSVGEADTRGFRLSADSFTVL